MTFKATDHVLNALNSVPAQEWPARAARLAYLWYGDASKRNRTNARNVINAGVERGLLIREGVRVRPSETSYKAS